MTKRILEIVLVGLVAIFFLIMGITALIDPQGTLRVFEPQIFNSDMRNEIRAVYGGFGIAVGGTLLATLKYASIAGGARAAIAIALIGMATGRTISFVLEPALSSFPALFLGAELLMASMLYISLRVSE